MGARLGMLNLLIPNPRSIAGLMRTLQGLRVNMPAAVNTLFNALLNYASCARLDFAWVVVIRAPQVTAVYWFRFDEPAT